jgi:hypothetical protein
VTSAFAVRLIAFIIPVASAFWESVEGEIEAFVAATFTIPTLLARFTSENFNQTIKFSAIPVTAVICDGGSGAIFPTVT